MLTIQNIIKVWKRDVGEWRIGKIETTNGAYLFQLYKFNRRERMQVNLERNRIGNEEYELWCWEPNNNINPKPQRMLINKNAIQTPDKLINEMCLLIM